MSRIINDAGYYLVSLSSSYGSRLLLSNNERAFIISQLQDILRARSFLEEPNPHHRLASKVDLLAYSILPSNTQLLLFSISKHVAEMLGVFLSNRLIEYRSEWQITPSKHSTPLITIKKLIGPHDALQVSIKLHSQHSDWEFDRYSSIGFYIHDRRGDWMRLWRLTQLYDNSSEKYLHLLQTTRDISSINQLTAEPGAYLHAT